MIIISIIFIIPIYPGKIHKYKISYIKARKFTLTKFVIEKDSIKQKKLESSKFNDDFLSDLMLNDNEKKSHNKNNKINAISTINYEPNFKIDKIPIYPSAAKRMGQQGKVKLKITTDNHGKILNINIEESSGFHLLDGAAVDAIKKWNFKKIIDVTSQKNIIKTKITFRLER